MPHPRRSTARDVFIICPFDEQFTEQFNAIVFTIYDCGFYPRCALESSDSSELRFRTICRLIRECPYGIHDLSRVELSTSTNLPRFNMPLELGLGAKEFSRSNTKKKVCLVMDSDPYRYQQFCSDLAGIDIKAHNYHIGNLICIVRDWLRTNQEHDEQIPSGIYMSGRYLTFLSALPEICLGANLDVQRLIFRELKTVVENWLTGNNWRAEEDYPPAVP